jgi:hypothetical protein
MSSTSRECCASARTDRALPRRVAQGLADRLNGVLNRTVSDSRLSVAAIAGCSDVFELTRVVNEDKAPLELDGVSLCLFVKHVVAIEDGRCRTDSYSYRLQSDGWPKSWLIRWEYVRDPPRGDYAYPPAHVHVNATFADGTPVGHLHVPTGRVSLELVLRHLITDWNVKPRTEDWGDILDQTASGVGG